MIDLEDVPLPIELEGWPSWRDRWDEGLIRRAIAYYWGMVVCNNDQVGRIVESLQANGLFENTLIIFTSDHGEFLGERGCMGKGPLYDSITHMPLVVKPPADVSCCPGEVQGLTETMNIAPTILDYAGVPVPDTMSAHSLRPQIEGVSGDTEAVFCEYVTNDRSRWAKCVRTKTHKYVRWNPDGEHEFYDLVNDPLEQHNLARPGGSIPMVDELEGVLLDWLARTEWRHNYPNS